MAKLQRKVLDKLLATESIVSRLETLLPRVGGHPCGDSGGSSPENRDYRVLYFTRYLFTLR